MFEHFLVAQEPVYPQVLAELEAGRKQSHWMWFIFPQIAGLGHSAMSRRFALHSLSDAQAYLGHAVLGPRLRACVGAALAHAGKLTAREVMGSPDDMKLHSCLTLFARAAPEEELFREALWAFFEGKEDAATLSRL